MSDLVIRAEGLGKKYRLGARSATYGSLRESISSLASSPVRGLRRLAHTGGAMGSELAPEFWALRGVSLELERGSVLGVIGRNGAGKSTLLKILSRITEPTEGEVRIRGRVASLLEVGTGFNPELTGRENIYLNGAILGMTHREIARKFDEIVAFAEVEPFIDTQVKRFSSGMYLRLAFSVAAHLEPDILLVDEVLAVGDMEFQRKCLGRLENVSAQGRTIIFVSHNLLALQSLCDRAVRLDHGAIVDAGTAPEVVERYLQSASTAAQSERLWEDPDTAPGNDSVRIRRICVHPADSTDNPTLTVRTPIEMEFDYWNLTPGARLNLSIHMLNQHQIMVLDTSPIFEPIWHGKPLPAGLFRSVCQIPGDLLNNGMYSLEVLVVRNQGEVVFHQRDAASFEVADDPSSRDTYMGEWEGVVRPRLDWSTELVQTLVHA